VGHLKANLTVALQHVMTADEVFGAIGWLVDRRRMENHLTTIYMQDDISMFVQGGVVRALDGEPDGFRVGTRRQNKVIFELALVAVIHQADPRIDVRILNLSVVRNIPVPLLRTAADEVMASAREFAKTARKGGGACSDERHAEESAGGLDCAIAAGWLGTVGLRTGLAQTENSIASTRQKQCVAAAVGEEPGFSISLAEVRLEAEGQIAISLMNARYLCGVHIRGGALRP
jgi:hypothetical protein